jgi:hypothetical protein
MYSFRSDWYSHISSLSLIDGSKEGKQYSCRFLFKPHSKPLLLDSLTSGVDYIKESDYINKVSHHMFCSNKVNMSGFYQKLTQGVHSKSYIWPGVRQIHQRSNDLPVQHSINQL